MNTISPSVSHHSNPNTSLQNQSENNLNMPRKGTSNALFKTKEPVNYQVINTQRAIPALEQGGDYDLRKKEFTKQINMDLSKIGYGLTTLME